VDGDLSDEESEAFRLSQSRYAEIPACINAHAKTLKYRRAKNLLREIQPRTRRARELNPAIYLRWMLMAKGTSTRGPATSAERRRTRN